MGKPSQRTDNDGADSDFAATVASMPPMLDGSLPGVLLEPGESDLPASNPADLADEPTLSHIGRYALKNKLGEGGLGSVYEAWDPLLSRTVAVKTLQFKVEMPERVALDGLFLNEARAVAGLNHPHIVTVYDAGLSAHGVYIAMERLQGRDMRQALASGWHPSPPNAAHLMRRVADALAYAHARGVVHCDIKPANIFLTRKDRPTVLDFGIARVAHGAKGTAVPALEGLVAGSPHYLAPEQLQGGAIDARTDVYALGVVLYELLAGRKAFEGNSLDQIINAVLHGHPAPANELRPGVPPGLAGVCARAMARDPAERHASAAELAQALRHWQDPALHADPVLPVAAASRRPRILPRRWPGFAIGGLVIALGLWTLREQPEPVAAQAPPAAVSAAPATATVAPPPAEPPPTEAVAVAAEAQTGAPAVVPAPKPVKVAPAAARKPSPAAPVIVAAPIPPGLVQVAVSPWGEVEIDGRPAGITPPLVKLELPAGTHEVVIRNGDFPPFTARVEVHPDKPAVIRHRFGS